MSEAVPFFVMMMGSRDSRARFSISFKRVRRSLMGLIWGMTFALGAAAVNTPVLWLIVVVFFLVAWAAFIWLLVRLSLAVPMTLAEKRIVLFDSFSLTKRHFWPLIGMAGAAAAPGT